MTAKEIHEKLLIDIKNLYEEYPYLNPFNPECPLYEEGQKAMNKQMEKMIKEIIKNIKPTSK